MVAATAYLLVASDRSPAAERVAANGSIDCFHNQCPPEDSMVSNDRAARLVALRSSDCFQNPCPAPPDKNVVSNDSTSRFVALVINKTIVLDLPTATSDILIGNPKIANAVLRSKRRVYVVGLAAGQTNIFFYNAKGQQIDGLNVNVSDHEIAERIPTREILVVRGADETTKYHLQMFECTPTCSLAENAVAEKPPEPTYVVLPNVTSLPKP